MKCHGCGSTDHLIGACRVKGKGKGSFFADASAESATDAIHLSGPLAGLAMQGHWFIDTATGTWKKDAPATAVDDEIDIDSRLYSCS